MSRDQNAGVRRAIKVYLAGPDVFFADAEAVADVKRATCRSLGLEPLHPLDHPPLGARAIYLANAALLDAADCVVANLTPFRGPSADAGSVFEVGYAVARGLPVYGYSNDGRAFAARTPARAATRGGPLIGVDGMMVEDFGLGENLMITEGIALSGGAFLQPPADVVRPIDDLALFEDCLRLAAEPAAAPTP